ncbi:E2/UBC family protein [Larkinella terrae]|uniref:Uncharacterized protein n=1 Tax=Larkinella terrae TaxID=2025311 RepID=A0A7K0EHF4_9BACT|nr:E2/UBC family protein [Larkinella terrae]MRS61237.1 hypothetical protein [Larkinella terrae]
MNIGAQRLVQDLCDQGHEGMTILVDTNGMQYVMIPEFIIPAGSFAGRNINLAIPAPTDYPRSSIASIHIKALPHLATFGQTGTRNVITSPLGSEWQYWSYQFQLSPNNPTSKLLAQINAIFRQN